MAAPPPEQDDMVKKYVDMTKDFKAKADGLSTEITSAFNSSLGSAIKNYTEMQGSYLSGYTGIASGAAKANTQLLESMDKNYADLKGQMATIYADTQAKANQALDSGATDFQKQCEDIVKKFPMLPESAYKETLKAITDNKGKVNTLLEKQYKDVVGKLDKNFQATKKELTIPEIKTPKIPGLDVSPSIMDTAKSAITMAMSTAQSVQPSVVKSIVENVAGSSKNAKK